MNKLTTKKRTKKGFTLMEMLIVVAIIAILIAIAIPVFSAQMDKAREEVDAANLRSATSMAVVDYLSNSKSGIVTYSAIEGAADNTMEITTAAISAGNGYKPKHSDNKAPITIVIEDGEVKSADWQQ